MQPTNQPTTTNRVYLLNGLLFGPSLSVSVPLFFAGIFSLFPFVVFVQYMHVVVVVVIAVLLLEVGNRSNKIACPALLWQRRNKNPLPPAK